MRELRVDSLASVNVQTREALQLASIIQLSKLWVDITAECARARECASVRKCFAMFYVVRVCLFVCVCVCVHARAAHMQRFGSSAIGTHSIGLAILKVGGAV